MTCGYQRQNPLKIWDYASGKMIAAIEPDIHDSMVLTIIYFKINTNLFLQLYCGMYVNKDFFLCGGTESNLIRLVNTRAYTVNIQN